MENLKNLNKKINPHALTICQTLNQFGYQGYIVGGCVRDLILRSIPKDCDICTDASPEKIMELFPKNYPTGLAHGTVTVAMGEGKENHFEVTTFRVEGKYLDGRRPKSVSFVKDVKEDLARRDLTINAIAFDPIKEELIDPFDGLNDIQNQIIKAVGVAEDRFREDGLRLMRVARFAARFGYEIESKTFKAMKENCKMLRLISKERIKDEFFKLLETKNAFYGLNILKDTGIIHVFCRSLMGDFNNVDFPPDVSKCHGDVETKVALLYSQIQDFNDIQNDLFDLKLSNKETKKILFLLDLLRELKLHLRVEIDKNTYISIMARIKNSTHDDWEHTLSQFITLTDALNIDFKSIMEQQKSVVVFSRKELKINGNDLISCGISDGPQIRKILDNCYMEILRNPNNNDLDVLFKLAINYNTFS